jgi:DNA-binding transcriptional regulator YhcF (GntR family)
VLDTALSNMVGSNDLGFFANIGYGGWARMLPQVSYFNDPLRLRAGYVHPAPPMPRMFADDICMRLAAGERVPGQPLPPEKDLMETYGVLRPTLREAMRILEAESLTETSREMKGGITLRLPDPFVVIRQTAVLLQLNGATSACV